MKESTTHIESSATVKEEIKDNYKPIFDMSINPLDKRDYEIVKIIDLFKDRGIKVTQENIARNIGCSRKTIERRIKNLRESGVIDVVRVGSKRWEYVVHTRDFLPPHEKSQALSQSAYLGATKFSDFWGLGGVGGQIISDPPNHRTRKVICSITIVSTMNKTKDQVESNIEHEDISIIRDRFSLVPKGDYTLYSPDYNHSVGGAEKGSETHMKKEFFDKVAKDASQRCKNAGVEAKERRIQRLEAQEIDMKPERIMTAKAAHRKNYLKKSEKDYNCSDMAFLFQDLWEDSGYRGLPIRWTVRERKNIKDLIQDQGGQVVADYFRYVFKNWDSLVQRFGVVGYPSVPVIFGYRRTWLLEMLNGTKGVGKRQKVFGEYNKEAGDKMGSGDWGF